MMCLESKIDSHKIRTGQLSQDDWPRLSAACAKLEKAPLYVDDTPGLSLLDLRSRAQTLKRREPNLGVIFVDYLQLMAVGGSVESRLQEVSAVSRGLKALAKDLDVPVLALSQLSRAVEQRTDKRPVLSDLRESGSIEQDADIVMFIYRDEYYNGEESEQQGLAELHVAKHRNGPTGHGEARVPQALREVHLPPRRMNVDCLGCGRSFVTEEVVALPLHVSRRPVLRALPRRPRGPGGAAAHRPALRAQRPAAGVPVLPLRELRAPARHRRRATPSPAAGRPSSARGAGRRGGSCSTAPTGSGKTHLAAAVLREAIYMREVPCLFLNVPSWLQRLRDFRAFSGGDVLEWTFPRGFEIVVIDDLGTERGDNWTHDRLYSLINDRETRARLTLVDDEPRARRARVEARQGHLQPAVQALPAGPPRSPDGLPAEPVGRLRGTPCTTRRSGSRRRRSRSPPSAPSAPTSTASSQRTSRAG